MPSSLDLEMAIRRHLLGRGKGRCRRDGEEKTSEKLHFALICGSSSDLVANTELLVSVDESIPFSSSYLSLFKAEVWC